MNYEYAAVPAPPRSDKGKGGKTPAERYAATLADAINVMAAGGWEYLRAETLPSEERSGLTGRTTLFHNLLIFRREIEPAVAAAPEPQAEARREPSIITPPPLAPPKPTSQDPAPRAVPREAARNEGPARAPERKPAPAPVIKAESPAKDSKPSPVFSEPMRLSEKPKGQK
ncbi:MAG: DUF4177 domain-containing protein [Paracoccus sp. (in: a-proteobacteria)]